MGEEKNFRDLPLEPRNVKAWEGLLQVAPVYPNHAEMFYMQDIANIIIVSALTPECPPTKEALLLYIEAIKKIDLEVYRGPLPVHYLQAYYRQLAYSF